MLNATLHRRLLPGLIALSMTFATLQAADPDVQGVHNFHQVDQHVYRGAQPHGQGFVTLANLGIKTVIDLRGERSEANEVQATGMHYIRMAWSGYKAPSESQIQAVLALLNDNSAWPVFIHCRRGADRTGTAIACYRIAHDHWSNQQALDEAKTFGMSPMEVAMQRFILGFTMAPTAPAGAPPPATSATLTPVAAPAP